MFLMKHLRNKFSKSRFFAVCSCIVLAFVFDLVFWIIIQDVYKLSDFIVTLLSGLMFGLFFHEIAKTPREAFMDKSILRKI